MPVAASIALKAASTGPSPARGALGAAPVGVRRGARWRARWPPLFASVVSSVSVHGTAGGAFGAQHQRLDVAVEELLLLVGERLELLEHAVELELIELEAELP